ncbi:MAG: hypothetical protein AAF399_10070 [Bacteroidota bacterium]
MKRVWGVLWVGMLLALPLQAADCDCETVEVADAVARADIVFSGTCIFVNTNWVSGGMKYTFSVDNNWKGGTDSLFIVHSAFEKDCGYKFEEGEAYLVFVRKKFSPKTDQCLGNRLLSTADLSQLGTPTSPRTSSLMMPMIWTIGLLGVGAMLFIGFVLFRSRRNSARQQLPKSY